MNDTLNWIETGGQFGRKRRFPFYTVVQVENGNFQATRDGNNKPSFGSPTLYGLVRMMGPCIRRNVPYWEFDETGIEV